MGVVGVLRIDRDQQARHDLGQRGTGQGQGLAQIGRRGGLGKLKLDLGPTGALSGQGEQTKCDPHVDLPLPTF